MTNFKTNLKKGLSYIAVYFAGLLTALIVFKITTFIAPQPLEAPGNQVGLLPISPQTSVRQLQNGAPDVQKLMAEMQKNFQKKMQDDEDMINNPMGQFLEIRKKMLQLLQEESKTPDLVFDQISDQHDTDIASHQDDKNYYFDVNLASIDQNSLKLDIKDGYIFINGEMKKEQKNESEEGVSASVTVSSFSKSTPIPTDADPKKAQIEQENSVLTITLPKKR